MNQTIYKIFEYGYLIIAVFFLYQTVVSWTTEPQRAYLYALFVIVALLMYFFKRNFRKKFESRKDKDS